ncbi:hypothetical protein AVEN_48384-1 [Araneus ventricosus]|uniref:Uncharacterized protein n=1 Tax=Araneus ventricosus TaxID=182803 RepID=A0A4Y2IF97_ARAVE|nr:hypothetical protein AVEN_48384-1 [Araneus ventricosus]
MNIEKCSVLSYTQEAQPWNHVYKINNLVLSRSQIHSRILGSSLTPNIDTMVSKTYRRLGILKRRTREFSSELALNALYCAYVRSNLQYCNIIRDPNYQNKIEIIERIQNNFLRYLLYKKMDFTLQDVSSSLLRNMPSLCSRRDVSCVLFFYKVINGSIDCNDILSSIGFAVPARFKNGCSEDSSQENSSLWGSVKEKIGAVSDNKLVKYGAAAGVAVVAAPALVSAAGFGSGGVAAGSAAAGVQSAWFGGTISGVTGSMFSGLQSIGAAGLGVAGKAVVAGTGSAAVGIYDRIKGKSKDDKTTGSEAAEVQSAWFGGTSSGLTGWMSSGAAGIYDTIKGKS